MHDRRRGGDVYGEEVVSQTQTLQRKKSVLNIERGLAADRAGFYPKRLLEEDCPSA
jgi:hypothetical protein